MDFSDSPDSEVKKLQDMVKQLEMQNQELRKSSLGSVTRPYSPSQSDNLDNVDVLDIQEDYGEAEDSWLFESPVKPPTPQQKSQSPYKWCKSNLKPGLVLIRGNLLSKMNSAAFMEEEEDMDDDYQQSESLTVFLDENSPVRRRSSRPITSPKTRLPAKEMEDDFGGEIRPRKSFQVANNKGRISHSPEDFLGEIQPRRPPPSMREDNMDLRHNDMSPGVVRPRKMHNVMNYDEAEPHAYMYQDLLDNHSRHAYDNEQDEMFPLHMDVNMGEVKPSKPLMDYDSDIKPRPRRSQEGIRPRGNPSDLSLDEFRVNIPSMDAARSRKTFVIDDYEDSDDSGPVVRRQPKRTLPQPSSSLKVSLPAGSPVRPRARRTPGTGSPYDSADNGYEDDNDGVVRRRSLPVAPNKAPPRPASSLSDNAIQHDTYTRPTPRTGAQIRALPRASGVVPRGSKVQPRRPAAEMGGFDYSWQDGCF